MELWTVSFAEPKVGGDLLGSRKSIILHLSQLLCHLTSPYSSSLLLHLLLLNCYAQCHLVAWMYDSTLLLNFIRFLWKGNIRCVQFASVPLKENKFSTVSRHCSIVLLITNTKHNQAKHCILSCCRTWENMAWLSVVFYRNASLIWACRMGEWKVK